MSDHTEHEAEELGDLIADWTRCESTTFAGNPAEPQTPGWRYSQGVRLLPSGLRRQAIHTLHQLLAYHGTVADQLGTAYHGTVADQLGTALTLLDALAVRALEEDKSAEDLTDMTTLVSIARMVLKSGESEAAQCLGIGNDMVPDIAEREVWIFVVMRGRSGLPSLPSVGHWVKIIMRRLWARVDVVPTVPQGDPLPTTPVANGTAEATPTTASPTEDVYSRATRHVDYCTELLVQTVGSAAGLPPRAVALGACTMGLVIAGMFPVDEARPRDVDRFEWDSSLLSRQGQFVQQAAVASVLGVRQLAQAARCSPEDVQTSAYKAVSAMQDSVLSDVFFA